MLATVTAKKYQITADPVKKLHESVLHESGKTISVLPLPNIIIAKTKLGSYNASRHWLESEVLFASQALFLFVVLNSHDCCGLETGKTPHKRIDFLLGQYCLAHWVTRFELILQWTSRNIQIKDDTQNFNCSQIPCSSSMFWWSKTKPLNPYPDLNNPDRLISSNRLKALFWEKHQLLLHLG